MWNLSVLRQQLLHQQLPLVQDLAWATHDFWLELEGVES